MNLMFDKAQGYLPFIWRVKLFLDFQIYML